MCFGLINVLWLWVPPLHYTVYDSVGQKCVSRKAAWGGWGEGEVQSICVDIKGLLYTMCRFPAAVVVKHFLTFSYWC